MTFMGRSKTDEQCREHRKDKCLKERNEKLKEIDEYRKWDRNCRSNYIAFKDKADKDKAEYNDMTGGHIGKKSNSKRKRLGEEANYFNGNNNDPERPVGSRGKMLDKTNDAVSLYCRDLRDDKGEYRQGKGNVDVACGGCTIRDKAEQITEQDKHKHRYQIGKVLLITRSYV